MNKNVLWVRRALTGVSLCIIIYLVIIKPIVTNHCLEKYGTEMNPYRLKLGIPILPESWNIVGKEETFTAWEPKSGKFGHHLKRIVHSGCDLESEVDNYTLPTKNGIPRFIEMTYIFKKGSGKDSLQIMYQIDQSGQNISKKQLDSIFDADGVKKDY